jgi:hypothetical protein
LLIFLLHTTHTPFQAMPSFRFVKIPADNALPIEELIADTAGGLTDDALVKAAKEYFFVLSGSAARVEQIDAAGPTERQAMAAQIRLQLSESPQAAARVKELSDDAVLQIIHSSQSAAACDISALTVPLQANDFIGVSMYVAQDGVAHALPTNPRATALVAAAGHAVQTDIVGDVFVGRYKDDEIADIWQRLDFTVADADSGADWCRQARKKGGGGGSGKSAAASLGNLVQKTQQQGAGGGMQVMDTSGGAAGATANTGFGANGAAPVQEVWGTWTQTNDEVELKFTVATGTKGKYCKVLFGRQTLKVSVAGQVLLQGATFDLVITDESTFTLQDEGDIKELCITLAKTEQRTWAWTVR